MPLNLPPLDDRNYEDLRRQALARIPVHTPEWTNFGRSDPGVTLVEVFAFLTESLLYRAKQIPERNRLKFLSLLGLPLLPASAASGLVTFQNQRGPQLPLYLSPGLELRAGKVPFRTRAGMDVLPLDGQVFYKRAVEPTQPVKDHFELLYASYKVNTGDTALGFYETANMPAPTAGGVALVDSIDGCLWLALMLRETDKVESKAALREAIAGKILNIGIVPSTDESGLRIAPGSANLAVDAATWTLELPRVPAEGLPSDPLLRDAQYQTLAVVPAPTAPTVFEVKLPPAAELGLWELGPLESGVRGFPPALDDKKQNERVVTWIRVRPSAASGANVSWLGINAAMVEQRTLQQAEILPDGTGEPNQVAQLSRSPVLPESVRVRVADEAFGPVDDLASAGPEVAVQDARLPPGSRPPHPRPSKVFRVDAEAGKIQFGDGARGTRPPRGARISATYEYSLGDAGNVASGAIKSGPALPAGMKVTNPVRTWGGANAESVAEGERQVSRWVQHHDRMVSVADFELLVWRAPGLAIGRVDVLPAFHPEFSVDEPGDAPGTVTLMVIPRYDPEHPEAPVADQSFLRALAAYVEPRRLVTTEVLLRGPSYKPIWVSVGVKLVVGGTAVADVLKNVEAAVRAFLAPLSAASSAGDDRAALLTPGLSRARRGWPLRQPVYPQEIAAAVSRVEGVAWVNQVRLADEAGAEIDDAPIGMQKLELPVLARLAITVGDARPIRDLQGGTSGPSGPRVVPVPVVPEEC